MVKIDGSNLLDGIVGHRQEGIGLGEVSINGSAEKTGQAEKLTHSEHIEQVTYLKPEQEKKGGTAEDVMQQAGDMDATRMKNEMVVASNSTTAEDAKHMKEDGFSLNRTEIHTIVTETDKIKMQLAKAGVDISYFGDELSADQIQQQTGNAALTQSLVNKMQQSDLPLTPDNLRDLSEAGQQAAQLQPLSDGALKYMMDQELSPTIGNLYKAQFSGSAVYTVKNEEELDVSMMSDQLKRIAVQAGRDEDEEAVSDEMWMLQNQVLLTPANLAFMSELKNLQLPLDEAVVEAAMVDAIAVGGRPQDAVLIESDTFQARAQQAVNTIMNATEADLAYVVSQGQQVTVENLRMAQELIRSDVLTDEEQSQVTDLVERTKDAENEIEPEHIQTNEKADYNIDDLSDVSQSTNEGARTGSQITTMQYTQVQITMITARRQLEEVRVVMTTASVFSMYQRGISVDITPMEELIGQLKEAENQYFSKMLTQGGVEATQTTVSLFAETTLKLSQLKDMPVYALGVKTVDVSTIEGLHSAGSELQQNFQQANERYETMQTEVRKDLGDTIQKAFRNVDDILQDLKIDITNANERAVRILAYNHTEITSENILHMKLADQQVQKAFHNLTPAVVRELIGRGINPLNMNISQLNETAEQIKSELQIEAPEEKYSEYLFKLEQNQQITAEERSSYIGIYRLMNQIVQSDGAAIGAVVNQGAELTMRNLLTAVRSERHSGKLDISVDKEFGALENGGYTDSITAQIEAGYQKEVVSQLLNTLSPERVRVVEGQNDWQDLTPEQFLQQLQEAPEDVQAEQAYYRQQLEDLTQSAQQSQDVFRMLERYDLPNTVLNVMAAAEWMSDRNGAYRSFFSNSNGRQADANRTTDEYMTRHEDGSVEVDFEAIKQELLERCSEDIKKPKELAKAMAELAECAEHCTGTMIIDTEDSSIDIRSLKLMNAQMSLGARMAEDECFSLPIVVDGQVTNVTLKVVRGREQKGLVNITMETERLGKLGAELRAKEGSITGYVAADSRAGRDYLQAIDHEIIQALQEEQPEARVELSYVVNSELNLNQFMESGGQSIQAETEEEQEVQTRTLYAMAEGFIRVMQKIGR